MKRIILLFSIFLGFLLIPTLQESFAESEYSLSHFSAKGVGQSIGDEPTVVWTMINGDKGTLVWTLPDSYAVARLDMQPHHLCDEKSNVVCLNGTVTSTKNTVYVVEGAVVTIVFDMPQKETISFLSGNLIADGYEIELTKFRAKEASKIIEQRTDEIVDKLLQEVHAKILEAEDLLKNELLLEKLIESNQEFNNFEDLWAEIDKRNYEWEIERPDISPFEASLINNKVSDLLRDVMKKDSEKPTKFVYKEIILTNAYGANVAQTGHTTDYRQWDEQWWLLAKLEAINFQTGFDESAGIQSFDISIRITGIDGKFLGVIKFVINAEYP